MRKSEELSKNIEDMRNQLMDLVDEDFRINEIVRQLDYFHLNTRLDAEGMIEFRCEHGIIPIGRRFKENEMLYAFAIMSFYGILYYKCKKIIRRIRKKEYSLKINSLLLDMGRLIRQQALYNVKPNEKFETERFYKEFKDFIHIAIKALGHKYDQIGYRHLTDAYDAEEAEELKHIRAIYEKISFNDNKITYFDYIAKKSKTFCTEKTVEMQYMVLNLYAKAYTESVLWLKKEDPTGQWCPVTPWQLIRKLDVMIPDYFLY